MDFDKLKKGDKKIFLVQKEKILSKYVGRFDFLYLFNTEDKILPKVGTLDSNSIAILNYELLKKYGLSQEEVQAILHHEVGHIISRKQSQLSGLDLEFDADEYACSKMSRRIIISALEKTKNIIAKEATEQKKKSSISDINKRIENLKTKERKIEDKNERM